MAGKNPNTEELNELFLENQQLKEQLIDTHAAFINATQRALNAEGRLISIERKNLQPHLIQLQAQRQKAANEEAKRQKDAEPELEAVSE